LCTIVVCIRGADHVTAQGATRRKHMQACALILLSVHDVHAQCMTSAIAILRHHHSTLCMRNGSARNSLNALLHACTPYTCLLNMAQFDTLLETVQQFNAKDGERSGKSIVLSLLGPFSLTPQQGQSHYCNCNITQCTLASHSQPWARAIKSS
jgi:hypothetical protein